MSLNYYQQKRNQQLIIGAAGVVIIGAAIWYGFGSTSGIIKDCRSTVTKYVTAELSSTDSEGYTDYDSYVVSAKNTATTINGDTFSLNYNADMNFVDIKNKIYYPPMPNHSTEYENDYDFDNYEFHTETNLKVRTQLDNGEFSTFNSTISKHSRCVLNLERYAVISTWYGFTYDSSFSDD